MAEQDGIESDAATTEYRVLWWSSEHERWIEHAGRTDNPEVAAAWLEQARYHEWPNGSKAVMESRRVAPWAPCAPLFGDPDA